MSVSSIQRLLDFCAAQELSLQQEISSLSERLAIAMAQPPSSLATVEEARAAAAAAAAEVESLKTKISEMETAELGEDAAIDAYLSSRSTPAPVEVSAPEIPAEPVAEVPAPEIPVEPTPEVVLPTEYPEV